MKRASYQKRKAYAIKVSHDQFLRNLASKGVGLAIDYLKGLQTRHVRFPFQETIDGGLLASFNRLLSLGKKVLHRVAEIFGFKPRLLPHRYRTELVLEPLPA